MVLGGNRPLPGSTEAADRYLMNFSNRASVKKIDLVNDQDLVGNVSSEFKSSEPFEWARPTIEMA